MVGVAAGRDRRRDPGPRRAGAARASSLGPPAHRRPRPRPGLRPWALAVALAAALSAAAGDDLATAAVELALAAAVAALVWTASREEPPEALPRWLALGLAALALWALWQVTVGFDRAEPAVAALPEALRANAAERIGSGRAFASLLLPGHLAVVLATALPILAAAVRPSWRAVGWLVGSLLCGVGLVLTRSPIGISLAVLALAVLAARRRRALLIAGLVALAIGLVAVVAMRGDVGELEPLRLRADNWQTAIWAWRSSPLTGVGLGSYGQATRAVPIEVGNLPAHAHSLPLEWLAELGIVGLLAAAAGGLWLACLLRRLWPRRPELAVALAVVPLHNLVDFSLYTSGVALAVGSSARLGSGGRAAGPAGGRARPAPRAAGGCGRPHGRRRAAPRDQRDRRVGGPVRRLGRAARRRVARGAAARALARLTAAARGRVGARGGRRRSPFARGRRARPGAAVAASLGRRGGGGGRARAGARPGADGGGRRLDGAARAAPLGGAQGRLDRPPGQARGSGRCGPAMTAVAVPAAAAVALAVVLGGAFAPGQRLAVAVLIAAAAAWLVLAAVAGPARRGVAGSRRDRVGRRERRPGERLPAGREAAARRLARGVGGVAGAAARRREGAAVVRPPARRRRVRRGRGGAHRVRGGGAAADGRPVRQPERGRGPARPGGAGARARAFRGGAAGRPPPRCCWSRPGWSEPARGPACSRWWSSPACCCRGGGCGRWEWPRRWLPPASRWRGASRWRRMPWPGTGSRSGGRCGRWSRPRRWPASGRAGSRRRPAWCGSPMRARSPAGGMSSAAPSRPPTACSSAPGSSASGWRWRRRVAWWRRVRRSGETCAAAAPAVVAGIAVLALFHDCPRRRRRAVVVGRAARARLPGGRCTSRRRPERPSMRGCGCGSRRRSPWPSRCCGASPPPPWHGTCGGAGRRPRSSPSARSAPSRGSPSRWSGGSTSCWRDRSGRGRRRPRRSAGAAARSSSIREGRAPGRRSATSMPGLQRARSLAGRARWGAGGLRPGDRARAAPAVVLGAVGRLRALGGAARGRQPAGRARARRGAPLRARLAAARLAWRSTAGTLPEAPRASSGRARRRSQGRRRSLSDYERDLLLAPAWQVREIARRSVAHSRRGLLRRLDPRSAQTSSSTSANSRAIRRCE